MLRARRACLLVTGAVSWLSASTALAHIDLLEPEARAHGTAARGDTEIDDNSNLKKGPCGQVATGRTARVATYAPGQSLTVRVREENAHVSYLRVRIALDGESFPVRAQVPAAPETQEQALAAERALGEDGLLAVVREDNDTPGFVHEIDVTLPDVTCTNCTLQVIQFMYDDPAAPYYFQCADLVLAAPGGTQDAGAAAPNGGGNAIGSINPEQAGSPTASAPGPGGSGSGAVAPVAGAASGSPSPVAPRNGSASSTSASDNSAGKTATDGAADADEGCGLARSTREVPSPAIAATLALGLVIARRRRR